MYIMPFEGKFGSQKYVMMNQVLSASRANQKGTKLYIDVGKGHQDRDEQPLECHNLSLGCDN